jgi:hypothetical protein
MKIGAAAAFGFPPDSALLCIELAVLLDPERNIFGQQLRG